MITINNIKINAFVDFGNGFKFSIEDIVKESHDIYGESIIIKVHPSSKRWIEIEQKLKNNETKSIKEKNPYKLQRLWIKHLIEWKQLSTEYNTIRIHYIQFCKKYINYERITKYSSRRIL